MRYENNVIELKDYRLSGCVCGFPERRSTGKGWLHRLLSDLAVAVEVIVSAAIGLGFTACVLIFCTML